MWVTPRRAARMAAQPLALDEAMVWLVRAAPTPPELVAALAGAHHADNPGDASPVACAPYGRCVLLPMTRDGQRYKTGTLRRILRARPRLQLVRGQKQEEGPMPS